MRLGPSGLHAVSHASLKKVVLWAGDVAEQWAFANIRLAFLYKHYIFICVSACMYACVYACVPVCVCVSMVNVP